MMSAREWYDRWEAERVAHDDDSAERQAERDHRDREAERAALAADDEWEGPC